MGSNSEPCSAEARKREGLVGVMLLNSSAFKSGFISCTNYQSNLYSCTHAQLYLQVYLIICVFGVSKFSQDLTLHCQVGSQPQLQIINNHLTCRPPGNPRSHTALSTGILSQGNTPDAQSCWVSWEYSVTLVCRHHSVQFSQSARKVILLSLPYHICIVCTIAGLVYHHISVHIFSCLLCIVKMNYHYLPRSEP